MKYLSGTAGKWLRSSSVTVSIEVFVLSLRFSFLISLTGGVVNSLWIEVISGWFSELWVKTGVSVGKDILDGA